MLKKSIDSYLAQKYLFQHVLAGVLFTAGELPPDPRKLEMGKTTQIQKKVKLYAGSGWSKLDPPNQPV